MKSFKLMSTFKTCRTSPSFSCLKTGKSKICSSKYPEVCSKYPAGHECGKSRAKCVSTDDLAKSKRLVESRSFFDGSKPELDMALDLGGLGASVFAPTAGVRFDSLVSHQMRLQTGSVGRGIRANVAEKRLDPLMSLYVSGEFEFGVRGVGANVTFCHFLIAMPFDMSG